MTNMTHAVLVPTGLAIFIHVISSCTLPLTLLELDLFTPDCVAVMNKTCVRSDVGLPIWSHMLD